jgi:hypothetical protein
MFWKYHKLQVFSKNTIDYTFKMYPYRSVWLADLMGDQPELLVTEKKGCFEGSFVGNVGMPGSRDLAGEQWYWTRKGGKKHRETRSRLGSDWLFRRVICVLFAKNHVSFFGIVHFILCLT